MTTAALFPEVKAYDATLTLKPPKTTMETSSDQARALYSNIHSGISNRGNYRGGGSGSGKQGGNSCGGKKGYKRNTDFEPNKYCTVHERQGHDAEHCRKAAYEQKQEEQGSNGPKQSDRPYQPSFKRYQMYATVTRFLAHSLLTIHTNG